MFKSPKNRILSESLSRLKGLDWVRQKGRAKTYHPTAVIVFLPGFPTWVCLFFLGLNSTTVHPAGYATKPKIIFILKYFPIPSLDFVGAIPWRLCFARLT